jgi:xylulose-5-phosphate/fructose-6-phosphate phosphoketolase
MAAALSERQFALMRRRSTPNADALIRQCDLLLAHHHDWVCEHLDDIPEIRDWTWTQRGRP